jgi:hypothetical protein
MLLSIKSQKNMVGIHPFLVMFTTLLMQEMNKRKEKNLNYTDFTVFEGLRSEKKQLKNIKKGVSKTFDTYHFYGLAIDLVVYIKGVGITWDDKKYKNNYDILLRVSKEIINNNNLPIQNGFDLWGWDKPHFQMTNYKKTFDSRKILSKFL